MASILSEDFLDSVDLSGLVEAGREFDECVEEVL